MVFHALLLGVGEVKAVAAEAVREFDVAGLGCGFECGDLFGGEGSDGSGDAVVFHALLLGVGEVKPVVAGAGFGSRPGVGGAGRGGEGDGGHAEGRGSQTGANDSAE